MKSLGSLVLKLPRFSFRTKIAILLAWTILFATCLPTFSIYTVAMQEAIRQLGQRLMAVAITGAVSIDGDIHKTLTQPGQMESADYKKIQAYLRQLKDRNKAIKLRYIYTMAPTEIPGVWKYVVDAEDTDSRYFSLLGEREDFTYDDRWLEPLVEPHADEKLRRYRYWGRLLSASAPIRDSSGQSVGVLSVDAEPDEVLKALLRLKYWGIGFLALGLLLAVSLSIPISASVTRPISALIMATKAIARGEFEHRVNISSREELGALAAAFNAMADGLRERELFKTQFERYVSHQVARKILSNPAKTFWAAERKRASVLFCDIRGFTAIAEQQDPEKIITQLNVFFSEMIDIVFRYEGTVDKFMGDAIMAVFGAPLSSGNDEERAIMTACAMQKKVAELNQVWQLEGVTGFRIGIGINTGDVVVGNIGSERRMEYSAIGDTVNTAARLEQLNKQLGTSILISESTFEAVKSKVEARLVTTENLRGRAEPVRVYELVGLKNESPIPAA